MEKWRVLLASVVQALDFVKAREERVLSGLQGGDSATTTRIDRLGTDRHPDATHADARQA